MSAAANSLSAFSGSPVTSASQARPNSSAAYSPGVCGALAATWPSAGGEMGSHALHSRRHFGHVGQITGLQHHRLIERLWIADGTHQPNGADVEAGPFHHVNHYVDPAIVRRGLGRHLGERHFQASALLVDGPDGGFEILPDEVFLIDRTHRNLVHGDLQ